MADQRDMVSMDEGYTSRFDEKYSTSRRLGVDNMADCLDITPTTVAQQIAADGWMKSSKPVGRPWGIPDDPPDCDTYPLSGLAGGDRVNGTAASPYNSNRSY